MKRLIDEEDAIRAICKVCYAQESGDYKECKYYPCDDVKALEALPSTDVERIKAIMKEANEKDKAEHMGRPTDLISRADAIEAVRWETSKLGRGLLGKGDILDIIEALPSAEQHNKDAISREGLLRSWEELSPRGRTEFDQVIMTIPALPSAETHEIRTETHECVKETHDTDLISRADAIEAVAQQWLLEASAESPYVSEDDIDDYRKLAEELLSDIPSAEAEQVTSKLNNPCDSLLTGGSDTCKESGSKLEVAEAVQGWIPCSERLPDVDRAVLASGYYNDVYIATLKEDKREEYYWSAFGGFPVMFSAVDAWQPLPTPYKGGDTE